METRKEGRDIVVGDCICEPDGFMWRVDKIVKEKPSFRDLEISPVHQTILKEKPRTLRISTRRVFSVFVQG